MKDKMIENIIKSNTLLVDKNRLLLNDLILLSKFIAYGNGKKEYIESIIVKYKDKDFKRSGGMYDYD